MLKGFRNYFYFSTWNIPLYSGLKEESVKILFLLGEILLNISPNTYIYVFFVFLSSSIFWNSSPTYFKPLLHPTGLLGFCSFFRHFSLFLSVWFPLLCIQVQFFLLQKCNLLLSQYSSDIIFLSLKFLCFYYIVDFLLIVIILEFLIVSIFPSCSSCFIF